jgi:hypothetical protein
MVSLVSALLSHHSVNEEVSMEVSQLLRDRGYAPERAAGLVGILKHALELHLGLDFPPRPSIYLRLTNQADRFRQDFAGLAIHLASTMIIQGSRSDINQRPQKLQSVDWSEHVGYSGLRGEELANSMYEKRVEFFKKVRTKS